MPVSVDIDAGYGASPEAVAPSVRAVIDAGAVGIDLEDDIRHEALRDIDDAARRIAAAREAAHEVGVPIVINARVDAWIVGGSATDSERAGGTLRRARAYLAAGPIAPTSVIATTASTGSTFFGVSPFLRSEDHRARISPHEALAVESKCRFAAALLISINRKRERARHATV